jgi:hypothetical protein
MEVKGTALLARRGFIDKDHGAGTFERILRKQAAIDPLFSTPILATTRIPIEPFLRLNERIVAELYHGDARSYLRVGEQSAEWALGEGGPYRSLIKDRDVAAFVRSAPAIYRNYFTEGVAESSITPPTKEQVARGEGGKVALHLYDIAIAHVYFEYAIVGYFRHGLELVSGQRVAETCVRGFSKGDRDVLYTYTLKSPR